MQTNNKRTHSPAYRGTRAVVAALFSPSKTLAIDISDRLWLTQAARFWWSVSDCLSTYSLAQVAVFSQKVGG